MWSAASSRSTRPALLVMYLHQTARHSPGYYAPVRNPARSETVSMVMKALWILPVVLLMTGCSQEDTNHIETDAQKMAKDAGQAASSLTLAGKVNSVLRLMKKIEGSDVSVTALDGVVTVSGKATDDTQKKFILETAEGVKGVDKVVDHLVIGK